MAYKASEEIKNFIKSEEKLKLKAYDDYGKTSVGYGIRGTGKKSVTPKEAEEMFNARMIVAEKEVNEDITNPNLTQSQADVIFDMHFNGGRGMIQENATRINDGDLAGVEASLDKYIHATDPKTKNKVVVQALVDRAAKRKQMWGQGQPAMSGDIPVVERPTTVADVPAVQPTAITPKVNTTVGKVNAPVEYEEITVPKMVQAPGVDPLDAELDAFEKEDVQAEEVNPDRELENELNQFEVEQGGNGPYTQMENTLSTASDAAPQDTTEVQEGKAIAKETGAPLSLVMGMMSEGYKAKEIRAKAHIGDLARHYPSASRWASRPENFAVLQEAGADWVKTVENTTKEIGNDSNVERAFDTGLLTMGEVAVSLSFALGTLTAEEAEERYEALDEQKKQRAVKDADLDLLREKWGKYVKDGGSLWDVISYTAQKPGALGLQSIESAMTSAIPFVTSMTGVVFPPALPYAVGGAFLSGGAIAYGSKFRENLEQFRDARTNKLDLKKALKDKDMVTRWQKEAAVYGAVMGTFDAAFGLVAGKMFPLLGKAGAAGKTAGAVAEVASGPVSEGLSETLASNASDAYAGKLTNLKKEENKRSGILEGFMSIPLEGTMGPLAYGVRKISPQATIKAKKTVELAIEGVNAVKSGSAMSKLRAEITKHKDKYPEQVKDLLDTINEVDPQEPTAQPVEQTFDNVGENVEEEIKGMDKDAHKGFVHISPSDWIEYYSAQNKDPYTMIQYFGSDIHSMFMSNESSDSSIAIPLSEWAMLAASDPNIDLMARFQKNKFNAKEGDELMREMDEDPTKMYEPGEFDLFQKDPEFAGQEPKAEPIPMTIIEATQAEGNAILRPVDLVGKFNSDAEKRVFGGLKRKLQKVGKELNLPKDSTDSFSDVQFMRLKNRAAIMGRDVGELYDNTSISVYNSPDAGHMGFFATNKIIGEKTKLAFNKGKKNFIDVVIHEFGHSWLHEMAEDYHFIKGIKPEAMTPAQKAYSDSMDIAADHLGLKNVQDILNMDKETYTKLHETFAQTTELYFLEGKYANNKIKAVMESFRNWIVETLQYIKMVANRYPTLKITPEVERMFEGILGTSNKVEEETIPLFSMQEYPDEFLGPYAQKFKDAQADVQTEVIGEVYFKSFNGSLKEREAVIKKSMDRITSEAIQDVDDLQSMQFLKAMESAHMDYKSGGSDSDPRLSYESVLAELLGGNEADAAWLKDMLPTSVMTGKKKGGVDVRDYMFQEQINDPSVILDLLIQTTKREEMIDARIKEKIAKEFPVTKTDEEIHEIAVKAVNGVAKERYLMMELDLFAEKHMTAYKNMGAKLIEPPTGKGKLTREILGKEAYDLVLDAAAVTFSPDKFLRDSQRLAREASKAFKKNDIVAAFNAKKRETVLFMAYREAQTAQKILAKARQTSRLLLKYAPDRQAMKRMDTDIIKFGFHLVNAIKDGKPLPKLADIKISEFSGVTAAQSFLIDVKRNALVEVMQSRVGKNLSVEGGLYYAALLDAVVFVANRAKKIEIGGKTMLIDDAEDAIMATVSNDGPVVSYEKSWFLAASRRRVSNHKVSTGLASLYKDSKEFSSSVFGQMMGSIRDGESNVSLVIADAEKRLYNAFQKIQKTGKSRSLKESIFAPLKRLTDTHPIHSGKGELNFTFRNEGDMLMALATALGSESGLMRFLSSINPSTGKPIAEFNPTTGEIDSSGLNNFVSRMIKEGKLRKEHFELFQEIWNIFEERHPGVAKVMRQTDGIEMGYIKGKSFNNEFGEWSGGYVPVAEEASMDKAMARQGLMDVDSNGMIFTDFYPTMGTGNTKERMTQSIGALDLDMRKILSYVSSSAKIEHLRIPMMTFGTVIKRPAVAARIEQRRPDFIRNVAVPWFDYTANQIYTDPDTKILHTLAGKFRKNANTVMYLGSVFGTPVRQMYGLFPSAQRVGKKNLSRSLVKMASPSGMRETLAFAHSKSVFLRDRVKGGQKKYVKSNDLIETTFDWWSTMSDKTDFFTYVLTQATQNVVDTACWDAAYFNAIEDGMSDKSAIRFADSAVADSQGSPNVSDMPMALRGNNFERLATMVTSVPIAMHNMMAEEMMRTPKGKEKAKIAASMGFLMLAIPMLLESGLGELADDDEDKDTQDKLQIMGLKTAAGFIDSGFPVISRFATGYMTYKNPSISPALSKLTNAARVPTILGNSLEGVDMSAKEFALCLESFTLFTGIPTSVGGRAIRFIDNQKTDQEKKPLLRRRRRQLRVARRPK